MPTYPQTSFAVPSGALQLTLVRHGQTQPADPDGPGFDLKHGHGDPGLTALGIRQADAVAQQLRDESIDGLYVSSLTRTHQTAHPLAAHLGIEPVEEHDLREVFLGDWEGGLLRHMLAMQQHPGAIAFRQTYEWGNIPNAETNAELQARASSAVSRIAAQHRNQHIVAFVHGGVIASLCAQATGAHMRAFAGSDNGAIHRLAITEDRWFLRSFNVSTHLGDCMTPPAEIVAHA